MNHEMLYSATASHLQTLHREAERERLLRSVPTSPPVQVAAPATLLQRVWALLVPATTPVCCAE